MYIYASKTGELAEWLNAAVLKTVKDASPSGVRIPDSPLKIKKPQNWYENAFLRLALMSSV
jgi:hypothetical protein